MDARTRYLEFVNAMLEKAKQKEEAQPNSSDNVDMKQIEEITEKIKEELPAKLRKRY